VEDKVGSFTSGCYIACMRPMTCVRLNNGRGRKEKKIYPMRVEWTRRLRVDEVGNIQRVASRCRCAPQCSARTPQALDATYSTTLTVSISDK
jgi:hypothetical protein